jgi:hypothetical protein
MWEGRAVADGLRRQSVSMVLPGRNGTGRAVTRTPIEDREQADSESLMRGCDSACGGVKYSGRLKPSKTAVPRACYRSVVAILFLFFAILL